MKCNLSAANPCPRDAEYEVRWHMSFDPGPITNYVCQRCIDTKPNMVVIDSMRPLTDAERGRES